MNKHIALSDFCNNIVYLLLFFFIYSTGCQNKQHTDESNKNFKTINIDTITDKELKFSDVFCKAKIIALETSNKSVIGRIDQLEIFNDTIFILDNHSTKGLYLFTIEGKFINRIGKIGKGPGELLNPRSFEIDKKKREIFILDINTRSINVFDFNGLFRNKISFKVNCNYSEFTISDDYFYYLNLSETPFEMLHYVNRKTPERIINSLFDYRVYNKRFFQSLLLGRYFYPTKNDLKYTILYCDTIFRIKNSTISPFIVLESKNTMPKDFNEDLNDNKVRYKISYLYGIYNYLENDNLIYFKFFNNSKRYCLFYYPNKNQIYCTSEFIDDIFNQKTYPIDLAFYNNQLVAILNPYGKENIKENIEKNQYISEEDKLKIKNHNGYDNPLIFLYEFKE